jgi:hypothetical protein
MYLYLMKLRIIKMKKTIINILLAVFLISFIPVETYSHPGVKVAHRTSFVKWPRHRRHVVILYRYHHRRHRIFRLPPPWLPRDPWW